MKSAISSFHSKTKSGSDYVCTSCHRMMYRQSVIPCKYTKYNSEVVKQVLSGAYVYICSDGKKWMCLTCDRALSRDKIPVQSKANGLCLDIVPPELSILELRLISLRVPFMKMVALPSGKQKCILGPAVNVPSNLKSIYTILPRLPSQTELKSIYTILPRLPSQTELIPLNLKRKLSYDVRTFNSGHYMYNYIRPEHIFNALRWLKVNNTIYSDIQVNDNWLTETLDNDSDLVDCLLEQPETSNTEDTLVTCSTENTPTSIDLSQEEVGCSNNISSAYCILTERAKENGYTILS